MFSPIRLLKGRQALFLKPVTPLRLFELPSSCGGQPTAPSDPPSLAFSHPGESETHRTFYTRKTHWEKSLVVCIQNVRLLGAVTGALSLLLDRRPLSQKRFPHPESKKDAVSDIQVSELL